MLLQENYYKKGNRLGECNKDKSHSVTTSRRLSKANKSHRKIRKRGQRKNKKFREKKSAKSQENLENWIGLTTKTLISLKVKTDPVKFKDLEKAVKKSMELIDKLYADLIESRRETTSLSKKWSNVLKMKLNWKTLRLIRLYPEIAVLILITIRTNYAKIE